MGEFINKTKGRIKQAAADLTGDQRLRAEGENDEAKGKAQGVVNAVKSAAKDVKRAVKSALK